MRRYVIFLVLFCGLDAAVADKVRVTVGDTGCPGRQIAITRCWVKIPGVTQVTVLPRQPDEPAAQRVFVIVSEAAPPSENSLREALGRRAKHYSILKYVSEAASPN